MSEELKSWHQRIQLQKTHAGGMDEQSSTSMKSPASPHLPSFQQVGADSDRMKRLYARLINRSIISTPFSQGSGNVVLQRDPDGTPVQWFVAEDAEIVSQV